MSESRADESAAATDETAGSNPQRRRRLRRMSYRNEIDITEFEIGAGDINVTNLPTSRLITELIGSNVAVAVYDPEAKVAGLLQFLLPHFKLDKHSALKNPAVFADTGIPQLYRRCYKLGAEKERMRCYLVGGADVIDRSGSYHPGAENVRSALDVLTRNGVRVERQWIGGNVSRRLELSAADGRIRVFSVSREEVGA